MEHHTCADLESLFPYSRHFSANAQGVHGNYKFPVMGEVMEELMYKHASTLVLTLT